MPKDTARRRARRNNSLGALNASTAWVSERCLPTNVIFHAAMKKQEKKCKKILTHPYYGV